MGSVLVALNGAEVCLPVDKGSDVIKGWVVTRGQIDITQQNGKEWKAHHGKRAPDLHGWPASAASSRRSPRSRERSTRSRS